MLKRSQLVPVVALGDPDDAVPLAKALMQGGIEVIELTLRTPNAFDGIEMLKRADTGIVLGVGTVVDTDQVERCADIGVDFIVTPGTTPRLADAMAAANVPAIPGISTVGEAVAMLERGYELVKFFPAEASGGVSALKAIGGPLPQLSFMPTGGIGRGDVRRYLDLPNVVCVGGSWVADKASLADRDWDAITRNAEAATSL
ncbi:bifunctional 4-hydroxy-2-oxoglutarate aldolase/2-dehydro-3-deoxy-phosphogluconate aldolase [uncultured Algimonas sp.]|uniref:bifunctional 4-hydroxy-2-oxoglutarate aldolase/2-dehydro-3-deoxy-phosphogluconate aldolase n=1 Tax=uncultured Algimonas sp. TaxID=1547920 RepID=UPI00263490DF|nr:bifunctional 4-hydroxy-2-oxoglutarate aldolase/2-dehydro-3-deoxy-phosphogluconate aldolase [uncultured Algimonas sp.]